MKKALPLLALLLVVAALAVFTLRRTGGGAASFPVGRAAELVPADAIAFLQFEDFTRSTARWERSELGAITPAPAWQGGPWPDPLSIDGPVGLGGYLPAKAEIIWIFSQLLPLGKIAPVGLFLAVTSLAEEPLPKVILGFPYRSKKGEVEEAVRTAKQQLLQSWTGAKSELSTHEGIEIESITSATPRRDPTKTATPSIPNPAVHLAFRDDWFFFSTDRALLFATLDRYLRKPALAASLAANPLFMECRKHEVPEPDFIAWAPWNAGGEGIVRYWLPRDAPVEPCQRSGLRAIHFSARLDGTVRERVYFHVGETPPQTPPLAKGALVLTTPQTRGFATINLAAVPGEKAWLQRGFSDSKDWSRLAALIRPGDTLSGGDPWAAFSPEVSLIFSDGNSARPALVVALEVRDHVNARKFIRAMIPKNTPFAEVPEWGTTRWDWTREDHWNHDFDSLIGEFRPPIVLTKTHLLFGSRHAVLDTAWRAGQEGPTLEANPAYVAAVRDLPVANGAFFFLEPGRYFHNGTVALPWLSWSFSPPLLQALPKGTLAGTVAPGTICVRSEGPGWVMESTLNAIGSGVVSYLLQSSW